MATATPSGETPRPGFNEFCAKGVAAKKRGRVERERRESLMRAGVVDEDGLLPLDAREAVEDVFPLQPEWLNDGL